MDVGETIKELPVNEWTVWEMFEEMCKIEQDTVFKLKKLGLSFSHLISEKLAIDLKLC